MEFNELEIKLENKLKEQVILLEFLGHDFSDLVNFSDDWNKLLEVVEKIESIRHQKYGRFIVTISEDTCLIRSTNITKNDIYSKMYVSKNNKIGAVYESCLLFLKFWNNLNK